jgi:hypothetical protein
MSSSGERLTLQAGKADPYAARSGGTLKLIEALSGTPDPAAGFLRTCCLIAPHRMLDIEKTAIARVSVGDERRARPLCNLPYATNMSPIIRWPDLLIRRALPQSGPGWSVAILRSRSTALEAKR